MQNDWVSQHISSASGKRVARRSSSATSPGSITYATRELASMDHLRVVHDEIPFTPSGRVGLPQATPHRIAATVAPRTIDDELAFIQHAQDKTQSKAVPRHKSPRGRPTQSGRSQRASRAQWTHLKEAILGANALPDRSQSAHEMSGGMSLRSVAAHAVKAQAESLQAAKAAAMQALNEARALEREMNADHASPIKPEAEEVSMAKRLERLEQLFASIAPARGSALMMSSAAEEQAEPPAVAVATHANAAPVDSEMAKQLRRLERLEWLAADQAEAIRQRAAQGTSRVNELQSEMLAASQAEYLKTQAGLVDELQDEIETMRLEELALPMGILSLS